MDCMGGPQETIEWCNIPFFTCQAKAIPSLLELQQHRQQV